MNSEEVVFAQSYSQTNLIFIEQTVPDFTEPHAYRKGIRQMRTKAHSVIVETHCPEECFFVCVHQCVSLFAVFLILQQV